MFSRATHRAISSALRSAATSTPNIAESTQGVSRVARCLRKSFVRNFPGDDLAACIGNTRLQKRSIGTSAIKTTPVATQLKTALDDYEVDPELVSRFVVRKAMEEDCGDILRLIVGLAEWEGRGENVEITEEDLRRDGFGNNPCYQCVLLEAVEDDGASSIIGYAMFTTGYCTWKGRTVTWEDLFIHRDYRGKGLGAVMLHEVCKMGYLDGCRYVSGYVDFENERARDWYYDIGFENMTEQHGYNILTMGDAPLKRYVENHRPIEKLVKRGVHVTSTFGN